MASGMDVLGRREMGESLVLTLLAPNPVQTEVRHPIPAALRRKQKRKLRTQRLRASSTPGRSLGGAQGASSVPQAVRTFSPSRRGCGETVRGSGVPHPPGVPLSRSRERLNPGQLISRLGTEDGGPPSTEQNKLRERSDSHPNS